MAGWHATRVLQLLAALALGCSDAPRHSPPLSANLAPDAAGDAQSDAGSAPIDAGAAQFHPERVPWPDPSAPGEFWLSDTGVYSDIAHKTLSPQLHAFEPRYALWSDGADKQRWFFVPESERIDTSDMDHWSFPVGSLFMKEFSLEGKRLETRLVVRTGPGERDYFLGAFAWNDDESDARYLPDGASNVRGTEHDIPKSKFCSTCHDGEAGRVLGFSVVQHEPINAAQVTQPVPDFSMPGDDTTSAALGYIHANCGHCHNPGGSARPDTDMNLRVAVADRSPDDTAIYRSTIGVKMQYFEGSPLSIRVEAGEPEQSGLVYRMNSRGPKTQMPPIASELVDDAGVERVSRWIASLPRAHAGE